MTRHEREAEAKLSLAAGAITDAAKRWRDLPTADRAATLALAIRIAEGPRVDVLNELADMLRAGGVL